VFSLVTAYPRGLLGQGSSLTRRSAAAAIDGAPARLLRLGNRLDRRARLASPASWSGPAREALQRQPWQNLKMDLVRGLTLIGRK